MTPPVQTLNQNNLYRLRWPIAILISVIGINLLLNRDCNINRVYLYIVAFVLSFITILLINIFVGTSFPNEQLDNLVRKCQHSISDPRVSHFSMESFTSKTTTLLDHSNKKLVFVYRYNCFHLRLKKKSLTKIDGRKNYEKLLFSNFKRVFLDRFRPIKPMFGSKMASNDRNLLIVSKPDQKIRKFGREAADIF